jgi:hypothetical protein
MSEHATPTPARTGPVNNQGPRQPNRESPQLTSFSETVRRLLRRTTPGAEPMLSRAGVRSEAHRVRAFLQAAMKEQPLNGGK